MPDIVDPDAWSCSSCGHTFRSTAATAPRRLAQIRAIRDDHKCSLSRLIRNERSALKTAAALEGQQRKGRAREC